MCPYALVTQSDRGRYLRIARRQCEIFKPYRFRAALEGMRPLHRSDLQIDFACDITLWHANRDIVSARRRDVDVPVPLTHWTPTGVWPTPVLSCERRWVFVRIADDDARQIEPARRTNIGEP